MKKIVLTDRKDAENRRPDFSTAVILRFVLNTPMGGKSGMTVDEMRKRIRIMDMIDATSGRDVLLLEDADCAFLQECVKRTEWGIADAGLLAAIDDALSAEPHNISE